jgi:hypothetical protein
MDDATAARITAIDAELVALEESIREAVTRSFGGFGLALGISSLQITRLTDKEAALRSQRKSLRSES